MLHPKKLHLPKSSGVSNTIQSVDVSVEVDESDVVDLQEESMANEFVVTFVSNAERSHPNPLLLPNFAHHPTTRLQKLRSFTRLVT